MKSLVLRTLASQLFLDDAGVVCAALTAGSRKAGERLPRSASALQQQVPWMPPVNHPERHFLALVIPPHTLDDLSLLSRFVAPGRRVSKLHFCLPPYPTGGCMILLLQFPTVDESVSGVNPL